MQNTFGLEIYAANRQFFSGRAQSLIIPAEDGQKEFLAHHANMICAIVPGELRFQDAEGNWEVVAVSSGFVEMINNRAKLFCLTVERPDEIDIRRASGGDRRETGPGSLGAGPGRAASEAEYCRISQKPGRARQSHDPTPCNKRIKMISGFQRS